MGTMTEYIDYINRPKVDEKKDRWRYSYIDITRKDIKEARKKHQEQLKKERDNG